MKKRINSKWLSHRMTSIYCIDFSGHGSNLKDVIAEIEAAEAVICRQPKNSLLVTFDLSLTDFSPEIVSFINQRFTGAENPFRKIAFLGVSNTRRFWYQLTRHVIWPKNARFFNQYEQAKDWLITEIF